MHSIESKINHQEVSEEIYRTLTHEFPFIAHKGMSKDVLITTLTNKLIALPDREVLLWGLAVEEISKSNKENAPLPKEIIQAIKAKARELKPAMDAVSPRAVMERQGTDYESLWRNGTDKQKHDFFIDHKFSHVPPYIRYWFMKHNRDHRGWSTHESSMMVKYWALPFQHARHEAVTKKQNEIQQYFRDRKDG
tara:strand:- start:546 stop:1124 length:579 start_codon:yes stop_codon:yes gene_type:complete